MWSLLIKSSSLIVINDHSATENTKTQALLNQIVIEYFAEQKRKRIWRWVKRTALFLIILVIILTIIFSRSEELTARTKPHVGLIDIKGQIDNNPSSSETFARGMQKAYDNKELQALILRIDSPGGSPVQADYIYNLIQYYRNKYPAIKIYGVCVDTCASAAYYIAAATDEIYANQSSMVGSIGVVYNGFGFVDTMQKLGVSRRLQTAGRNKGFMDQFSPTNPQQEQQLQTMLDVIHQQFIDRVKTGRGKRLKIDEDTFSGLIWTGVQARERGLIDGFASSGQLARNIIKVDRVIDYTDKQNVLEQMTKSLGTTMMSQLPLLLGFRSGLS